jgi:hypothetical protein
MNTPKRADIPIEDHIAPTEAWLQIYPGYLFGMTSWNLKFQTQQMQLMVILLT